jgi:hypothetical protein
MDTVRLAPLLTFAYALPSCVVPHAATRRTTLPTATTTTASTATVQQVPPVLPKSRDVVETDFRVVFNGAPATATLVVRAGVATGKLFYDGIGVDIELVGTLDAAGRLTVNERVGAATVSTTMLFETAGRQWTGIWRKSDGSASGPATLKPVARSAGDPVAVATRHVHVRSEKICHSVTKPRAPCRRDARIPVVLGLADRAFSKQVNDRLAALAAFDPPSNDTGLGVNVSYAVVLNERGFLSVTFNGEYQAELACEAKRADCEGVYQYTHAGNAATGVTVAVDRGEIASNATDYLTLGGANARRELGAVVMRGVAKCVTAPDKPLADISRALLTPLGVSILYDRCSMHVHEYRWDVVPYGRLRDALRTASPFAEVWSHK